MKTLFSIVALAASTYLVAQSFQHTDVPMEVGYFSTLFCAEDVDEDLTLKAHSASGGVFVEMYCSERLVVSDLMLEHSIDNQLFVTIKDIRLPRVPGVDFYHGHLDKNAPDGTNYYRFRLRTTDGTVYFSEITKVAPFEVELTDEE